MSPINMQEKAMALSSSTAYSLKHRLRDYGQLMKFRLSLSVVFPLQWDICLLVKLV